MITLIVGLIIFLGVHSISIVSESWRDLMVAKIGVWTWKGLYSLISILGFILILWGYELVRGTSAELYTPHLWMRHLAFALLLPVFPLLIAAYFPGRIKAIVRHPMLIATLLWSGAHLLSNGFFADILLFGSVLSWAAVDLLSLTFRHPRPIPGAPSNKYNDALSLILGVALYFSFIFWLHESIIGVALV